MTPPVDITFRGLETTPAIDARIRQLAERLTTVYSRIIRVDVAVELRHRRGSKGQRYHVRVKIEVPGNDVVISDDPGDNDAHEDIYVAIRDSFNAAHRRLARHVARMSA